MNPEKIAAAIENYRSDGHASHGTWRTPVTRLDLRSGSGHLRNFAVNDIPIKPLRERRVIDRSIQRIGYRCMKLPRSIREYNRHCLRLHIVSQFANPVGYHPVPYHVHNESSASAPGTSASCGNGAGEEIRIGDAEVKRIQKGCGDSPPPHNRIHPVPMPVTRVRKGVVIAPRSN